MICSQETHDACSCGHGLMIAGPLKWGPANAKGERGLYFFVEVRLPNGKTCAVTVVADHVGREASLFQMKEEYEEQFGVPFHTGNS